MREGRDVWGQDFIRVDGLRRRAARSLFRGDQGPALVGAAGRAGSGAPDRGVAHRPGQPGRRAAAAELFRRARSMGGDHRHGARRRLVLELFRAGADPRPRQESAAPELSRLKGCAGGRSRPEG